MYSSDEILAIEQAAEIAEREGIRLEKSKMETGRLKMRMYWIDELIFSTLHVYDCLNFLKGWESCVNHFERR